MLKYFCNSVGKRQFNLKKSMIIHSFNYFLLIEQGQGRKTFARAPNI